MSSDISDSSSEMDDSLEESLDNSSNVVRVIYFRTVFSTTPPSFMAILELLMHVWYSVESVP